MHGLPIVLLWVEVLELRRDAVRAQTGEPPALAQRPRAFASLLLRLCVERWSQQHGGAPRHRNEREEHSLPLSLLLQSTRAHTPSLQVALGLLRWK